MKTSRKASVPTQAGRAEWPSVSGEADRRVLEDDFPFGDRPVHFHGWRTAGKLVSKRMT